MRCLRFLGLNFLCSRHTSMSETELYFIRSFSPRVNELLTWPPVGHYWTPPKIFILYISSYLNVQQTLLTPSISLEEKFPPKIKKLSNWAPHSPLLDTPHELSILDPFSIFWSSKHLAGESNIVQILCTHLH